MDFAKLFADLAGEGVDAEAAAKALHETAPAVYQAIFRSGHSTATAQSKTKLDALAVEVDSYKEEVSKRDERLKSLEGDKPDIAKIEAKYQQAIADRDTRLTDLQKKLDTEQESNTATLKSTHLSIERERSQNILVRDYGVDPDYARIMLLDPDFEKRVLFDEKGRVSGALQDDGVTPVPVPSGKTLSDALARELAGRVPKKFIEDRRQGSSGLGKGQSGAGRIYKESEINSWSPSEYAANRDDVNKAMTDGRVISDS